MNKSSERPEPTGDARRATSQTKADDKDHDLIGQNLRRAYESVVQEPLPDRFKDLLDKLKKGEQ